MALYSNKKNIRLAKEAAGQIQSAGIRGMEAADTEKARSIAAEQTKFSVLTSLGTEGTYGPGATGTGGGGGGLGDSGNIFNTSGTGLSEKDQSLRSFGTYGGGEQLEGSRQGILDPEKYRDELSKSPLFQMQSLEVAEAKQLLEKDGPLWDMLNNSVMGSIHEGAALQLRDTMRQLKNNYAKGGSARRGAMNEFQTIIAQESAMRTRVQETWKANLKLHDYTKQNFERVRNGSMAFVDALPGLNESYRSAMLNTAQLAVQASKTAGVMAGEAYDLRMSQQAVNFGTKLVEGLISAVASAAIPGLGQIISGAGTASAKEAAMMTAARSGAEGGAGGAGRAASSLQHLPPHLVARARGI
ncbi:hypothetical protein LCGC14_1720350 [marine sediment metagenome]|uniref:Uncharacterized protein n=1 Tax=marine sediment metagenome TaxID=412755 RepID=A0A0F9JT32_9ZZZZ